MRRVRLITIVLLGLGALLLPVVALAATETVSVTARILHTGRPSGTRLRIVLNGHTAYDRPLRARLCGDQCMTTPVTPGHSILRVLDLGSNGTLDVVAGLYSGGAHCCFIDEVFTRRGHTDTYVQAAQHDFLDAGANLVRRAGAWEFDSADARIAEDAFTDYADSGAPVQIWRFAHGRFVDITRSYPERIAADAALWWKAYRGHLANGVGFIAAWAADEDLLGHSAFVATTLASEAHNHHLHSALGLPHNSETVFVAQLKRLLRELGYTR